MICCIYVFCMAVIITITTYHSHGALSTNTLDIMQYKMTLTFYIVWETSMDVFICLKCLVIIPDPPMTGCAHQLPFHLIGLHESCTFKVAQGFFSHLMLNEIGSQPVQHHQVRWIVPEWLQSVCLITQHNDQVIKAMKYWIWKQFHLNLTFMWPCIMINFL